MTEDVKLIELPAGELLARFGAGQATPGSGCAAALMALLAVKLIGAIAKLTIEKGSSARHAEQCSVMLMVLEDRIAPRLMDLFEMDATLFEEVIALRTARNAADDAKEKRKLAELANQKLRSATDILFEIAENAHQVLQNGVAVYRIGFRPAMGDAGAGISAAIAAITTCIFVVNLNVRVSRAQWAVDAKAKCDALQARLEAQQAEMFSLVAESGREAATAITRPFKF